MPEQGPTAEIAVKCQSCSGGFVLGAAAAGMQLRCACGSSVQVPDLILELVGPVSEASAESAHGESEASTPHPTASGC